MTPSDALTTHVRLRGEKLEHLSDCIVDCHVVVELAGHHHRHGDRFHVSIHLGLPGHTLDVGHTPSDEHALETASTAVDLAFHELERQLQDWGGRQRGQRHGEQASQKAS